ncbi:MAG: beta-lactamase family protein [Pseudomonadota bacterium]|nr:beta-lactamase family protein [Pseudomonadota bacterium]
MRYIFAATAIVCCATAPVGAAAPEAVPIPDTPAGRFASTFLTAYNSADPAQLERYNALYGRSTPPQAWIDTHGMTGRFTPVRIRASGPNEMTVLLAPELGDAFWESRVRIDPNDPMKVLEAALRPVDRPPEFAIPRLARAELHRAMEQKLAQDVAADRFAGTMMVSRHGQVIYQSASGLADREARVPVTMDTRFRIGSANKMFTAIGILQLVERGRIALDAPVGTYLTDYPNRDFAGTVTIRQLLSHTGGAGDIFTPEYEAQRLQVRTLADYVRLFGNRAPDTSEQGRNAYANYGFVLLGRIIEVVSGQDYYSYVEDNIFRPAGMTATGSLPESESVPNRSRGYTRSQGRLVDNADTLPWRGSAAGGGYTTAADMIRFGEALRSGRLLSREMLEQATSPQRPDGWYGFGFWLGGQGPTRNWGHGGGAPGMNAAFRVFPELDAVVVALANLDPLAADNQSDFYANRMALDE